jgi:hypothetical protein
MKQIILPQKNSPLAYLIQSADKEDDQNDAAQVLKTYSIIIIECNLPRNLVISNPIESGFWCRYG